MIFGLIIFLFLVLEIIYHIVCFGLTVMYPLITVGLCVSAAGLEAFVISLFRKKGKTIAFWFYLSLNVVIYGAQMIYWQVFKQPLLFSAVVNAGGDAVTNYWKEILDAILNAWLPVLLMIGALVFIGILYGKRKEISEEKRWHQRILYIIGFVTGILLFCGGLLVENLEIELTSRSYQEFFDPAAVFEEYGAFAGMQRDIHAVIFGNNTEDAFLELGDDDIAEDLAEDLPEITMQSETDSTAGAGEKGSSEENETETGETEEEVPEELPRDNVLPIDFQGLIAGEERTEVQALHQYVEGRTPTNRNDYTGMFEDYNLIYLTAEGFSPYCIDETVTPTLYKLTHSGFQFENFYVPLWHTSTSDGEFTNCTGLVPDQQFSFKRSAENVMPFGLPGFWKEEGVKCYAYHNNSLSYYERYRTHENLGYFFKAALPGGLPVEKWQDHLFTLENPKAWPQSDLEMMQATLGDYVNMPRFHAYYMTVSGHLKYTFSGNSMAGKNKEAVADLPYSNNAKAYVACNVELDKALEWLIAELEKAGKLDNTVICLAADHYPYGLEETEIEELRGAPFEKKYDIYRSSLILWNSAMEPVVVEKPCSSVDILPTLLNLFGFEYDSRLYSGQDILSDSSPLVIFSDRSFMTERVYYDARGKKTESFDGTEVDEEYIKEMKKQVKDAFTFSAGVLNFDYYATLGEYAPVDNVPIEDTLAEDTSTEDVPTEGAPAESLPAVGG